MRKPGFCQYVNRDTVTAQLFCAFVFDTQIPLIVKFSVTAQTSLCHTWSEILKTIFLLRGSDKSYNSALT